MGSKNETTIGYENNVRVGSLIEVLGSLIGYKVRVSSSVDTLDALVLLFYSMPFLWFFEYYLLDSMR